MNEGNRIEMKRLIVEASRDGIKWKELYPSSGVTFLPKGVDKSPTVLDVWATVDCSDVFILPSEPINVKGWKYIRFRVSIS